MKNVHEYLRMLGEDSVLILSKNNEEIYRSVGEGLKPLIEALGKVRGEIVVDRVIGAAAAFLIVALDAEEAYSRVISSRGVEILEANRIRWEALRLVRSILKEGKECPFERAVRGVKDPYEAVKRILEVYEGE